MTSDELRAEIARELVDLQKSDSDDLAARPAELRAALRDLDEQVLGPDLQAFVADRRRRRGLSAG